MEHTAHFPGCIIIQVTSSPMLKLSERRLAFYARLRKTSWHSQRSTYQKPSSIRGQKYAYELGRAIIGGPTLEPPPRALQDDPMTDSAQNMAARSRLRFEAGVASERG